MPSEVLIIFIIVAAIGTSLTFIGWLFSFLTALGNNQYLFGALACFIPPASHLYCILNWKRAAYAGKILFSGTALLCACLGFAASYNFELFEKRRPIPGRPTPLLPPTSPSDQQISSPARPVEPAQAQ